MIQLVVDCDTTDEELVVALKVVIDSILGLMPMNSDSWIVEPGDRLVVE